MNAEQKNVNTSNAEPTTTSAPVPMWLIVGVFVAFFLGGWFFEVRGGWFESKVYAPYRSNTDLALYRPPPADGPDYARGQLLYEQVCMQCHNTDGAGKPNQAPALAGSEWVTTKGVNRLIRIPQVGLVGPITVKGEPWNLSMAAMGAGWTDEDLANVLSYIRKAWNNNASPVTAEQVKKVRDDLKGRSNAYTGDELTKLEE